MAVEEIKQLNATKISKTDTGHIDAVKLMKTNLATDSFMEIGFQYESDPLNDLWVGKGLVDEQYQLIYGHDTLLWLV